MPKKKQPEKKAVSKNPSTPAAISPELKEVEGRKRITKAEKMNRVLTVYTMRVRGYDRTKILRMAAELWGLKDRQIEYYVTEADQWLKRVNDEEKGLIFMRSMAMRLDLYHKAYDSKELGLCHEIRKDMDRLNDLYPAEKRKHTFAGVIGTNTSPELAEAMKGMDTAKLEKLLDRLNAE